jgi:hypothetical protein
MKKSFWQWPSLLAQPPSFAETLQTQSANIQAGGQALPVGVLLNGK